MSKNFIDIPFGASDSELRGFKYTIPEGMEDEIKDGKDIAAQSAKDTIERIRAEIEKVIPKEIIFDNDEDYGRKDAFNYVLGVISTLEKEYE